MKIVQPQNISIHRLPYLASIALPVLCFLLAVLAVSCNIETKQNPEQKMTKLFNRYEAVQDSISTVYKNTWGPVSIAEYEGQAMVLSTILEDLTEVDVEKLSLDSRINKELLELELMNDLNDLNFRSYLMPFNSEGGFLADIVYTTQYADLSNTEKKSEYAEKLRSLASFIDSKKLMMEDGIKFGKVSPRIITERCISMLEQYVQSGPEDFFIVLPLQDADAQDSFRLVVTEIVKTDILPAYQKFLDYVKTDYLPASQTEPGISMLDGGKEYYEEKVRYYTTLNMTPDEVFQTGESEVKRIREAMEAIILTSGFKGDFNAFLKFLRTDPQFYAKTPRELLYRASWLSKKIEGKLPQYFNKMPRMPFAVEPVPEAIAPNYTGGRYSEGSYKTGKPGAYWVNTYKLESRPLYVLPALTLHEAVPGHHLQIMLSRELENVPKFRERLYISAFGEGWGLYSEYLGKEAGMYETAYEDFGRLTYEMWRACRLVVDVGLHYKGWSRDQAVNFMASNTALSMHEVNTEIDRYIGWPAQAVSYKIGELKIKALRKKAEDKLGDKFDIKAFHDIVLSKGSVKLTTLEQMVDDFIEKTAL